MNLTEKEKLMWVAGLLEGEGSFSHKGSGTDRNIVVQCHMTDLDVLQTLTEYAGCGKVRGPYKNGSKPHHKPRYMYQVHGPFAYALMREILPYMSRRRSERIIELITKYDNVEHN